MDVSRVQRMALSKPVTDQLHNLRRVGEFRVIETVNVIDPGEVDDGDTEYRKAFGLCVTHPADSTGDFPGKAESFVVLGDQDVNFR